MAPTLYKHKFIYVTREIPLKVYKTLKTVNKQTGLTIEEELLDYCRSPRSIIDLQRFLDIKSKKSIQARFTKPLMQQGKLKFIYPESPKSVWQRYLNTEVDITPEMQETMVQLAKTEKHLELERKTLKFCKNPRSLGEIKDHIGLAGYGIVRKRAVQPLIDQGKLKMLYPHDPFYVKQKYVIAEATIDFPALTEENIILFCSIPRTKEEIKKHFAIGQDLLYKFLNPIIEQGKLTYTKSVRIGKNIIHGKLVKNENPQKVIIKKRKITDEDIIEFCKIPRHHRELWEEFEISTRTCQKIVDRLIEDGRLVYTEEAKSYKRKVLKNDPVLVKMLNDTKLKDEDLIAYCRKPRLIQEIINNFGITNYECKKRLDRLFAAGELVYTEKARSWYRKIKAKGLTDDTVIKENVTDEDIISFCNVPRYAYEIKKEFHLSNTLFEKIVKKLINDERLINTEKGKGYYRKFLKNG